MIKRYGPIKNVKTKELACGIKIKKILINKKKLYFSKFAKIKNFEKFWSVNDYYLLDKLSYKYNPADLIKNKF